MVDGAGAGAATGSAEACDAARNTAAVMTVNVDLMMEPVWTAVASRSMERSDRVGRG